MAAANAMDSFTTWLRTSDLHAQLSVLMIVSGVATFLTLFFGPTAPYGRYQRKGWGFMLNANFAWLTQEIPSLLVVVFYCYQAGLTSFLDHPTSLRTLLATLFITHYTYRSLYYPTRIRGKNQTPFSIWVMSVVFCLWNGYLQGVYLAKRLSPRAPITPVSAVGLAIQLFGFLNVMWSDNRLITLRKPGETGYKIPTGGLFTFVSAANYCSEIIEWSGYALAAQGALAPLAFAVFVFCNLAPRGWQHHQWYLDKFKGEYPRSRRAIIPFIW